MASTDFKLCCFDCIPQKTFLTQTEIITFRPNKSKNLISPFAAVSPFPNRCSRNSSNNLGIKHSKWFKDYRFERRASNNDDLPSYQSSSSVDTGTVSQGSTSSGDAYIALFIRMLGTDNDPLDREQAVVALWQYSLGGKSCVDNIMQFRGAVNLVVNILQSPSDSACEAAAGVLRMISSVNMYRNVVAESGSIEEITAVLRRPSLSSNVKEQSIYTLCNLSVDEKLRIKIAKVELLHLLLKFLDDEDINVKEAAGGVLANLALSEQIHKIMVEAGAIPKLAKLLKPNVEGSKVIKKEARSALLEIAKEDYHKILIVEEGLLLVPLVGAAAYNSFKPALYSWPSLPDGTKIEQNPKISSKYGASELLLGLNVGENDVNLEEAKKNAIVGRTQQQFLARVGAIELENGDRSNCESSLSQRFTILPWIDGVARLVLILGLEDESAIARAADAIADSSINEHMRIAFKEAGAIKQLIRLLHHPDDKVLLAVIRAMERLSVSDYVCQNIEAEGVLHQLIKIFIQPETSSILTEMILSIINRILDPGKEMRSKFYDGPVNGSTSGLNAATSRLFDKTVVSDSANSLQPMNGEDLLDPTFLARLVMILKSSSPNLQKKAASILEFFAADESHVEKFVSVNISSALDAVFQHESLNDIESDIDDQRPELIALEVEEVGNAISAASRLFIRLVDFHQFRESIDTQHLTKLLRKLLKSNVPLNNKDWVAASIVKLSSFSGTNQDLENPVINQEVTIYETIPRLIEQIEMSFSPEDQETAAIELNRIVSEGLVDSTETVASAGGIFPLVKLIENGGISERAMEAGLAILYNLSMDSENHAAIISAGAIPILRRIVLSNKPQWMLALHMLRALPT